MSPKTPKDLAADMPILRRLYSKAYNKVGDVGDLAAGLVIDAYNSDQISWEEAQRQWWVIAGQAQEPASNSGSAQ